MDFSELLGIAEETHSKTLAKENNFRSTKVAASKKDPKAKKLSDNVTKYLNRQKTEEDAKRREAERKKNHLLQLRAESKESQKTVKRMLTKTKSANHSVISEAVDSRDTADTLAGRHQCDEDDYGYESNTARNFYEKLMTKYESCPYDPMSKFTKSQPKTAAKDATSTIARVKEALLKGDEPLPTFNHKNAKSKKGIEQDDFINDGPIFVGESFKKKESNEERKQREKEQAKLIEEEKQKKRKPPEANSFEELIKLAQAKHKQPIDVEKKTSMIKDNECGDRPMTKKQKEEFLRERASQMRKAGKTVNSDKNTIHEKMHLAKNEVSKNSSLSSTTQMNKLQKHNIQGTDTANISSQQQSKSSHAKSFSNNNQDQRKLEPHHVKAENRSNAKNSSIRTPSEKQKIQSASSSQKNKPLEQQKPKQVPRDIHSVQSRYFPGEKSLPFKPRHSNDIRKRRSRSRSPLHKSKNSSSAKKKLGKMRIESESEEDSEMDDFIDDSEANVDISAEIRNIFGYDRRKFRDEDDFDDRSMETNRFSDVMREEARSAKIGKMEDLEDMKREEDKRKKRLKTKHRR